VKMVQVTVTIPEDSVKYWLRYWDKAETEENIETLANEWASNVTAYGEDADTLDVCVQFCEVDLD
jgi:hypothetical protein